MMRYRSYQPTLPRDNPVLRLLLAALLVLTPVLTVAQSDSPAPVERASAAAKMPCHPGAGESTPGAAPSVSDSCPHCADDASASQCHCCGHAAPAGLGARFDTTAATPVSGPPRRQPTPDALPESPRDGLFRPPISRS